MPAVCFPRAMEIWEQLLFMDIMELREEPNRHKMDIALIVR